METQRLGDLLAAALLVSRSIRPLLVLFANVWRELILLVSTVMIWGLTTFGTALYWDGRLEPWMNEPDHWYLILPRMLLALLYLLVILFLPAVVGLFRSTWDRERPA